MHQQQIVLSYFAQLRLQISDALHINAEKYFKKQASESELVLVSRLTGKINKRNTEQQRTIVISSENIYNIDKKSIKRKISIHKIFGVTVSRSSYEFVLHVPQESDYRFKSQEYRDIILYYLSIVLKLNNKDGLRLYMVDNEELDQFCLHDATADCKKQIALHPKTKLLLLYPENFQLSYINLMFAQNKNLKNQSINILYVHDPLNLRVRLEDYQKLAILAQGSFSKVLLINQKIEKQTQFLVLKTIQSYNIDINILQFHLENYTQSQYMEQLELCLRQQDQIHFFFKFVRGGDLFSHLQEVNYFSEIEAKYIIAQIALGLSYLHESGTIYGDLKPENVLIDENGYVQLTDFGFGRLRVYQEFKKVQTINFTVEYAAPEYLLQGDLTRMSDWYSLGILLYELVIGISPFYHHNHEIAIKMICKGDLYFPKTPAISYECKDFITKLLQQDSQSRIGFENDFKEIQSHKWFQGLNWQELSEKKKSLPYIPKINDEDTVPQQYFRFEKLTDEEKGW
ncbi:unnamed protein product (macronuclear) [Paramecium tetraurelia]|uniref:Protein kinase domain-containing protein n=1 Tax=Paramecium tetraurelia TaxID=5888 RepID=A0CMK7_PARTE|nr:uncharacterized protein GSPATT00008503001 [Paramecium tetraurelia]CAK72024.1 unnamed protein product [Paramecium tetraurelia]|eukprot:XP_001439421.1 hypothetical protein (macronuclear) [Paramecium tetraurelia strain d4-2]